MANDEKLRADIERGVAMFNEIAKRLLAALPKPADPPFEVSGWLNRSPRNPGAHALITADKGLAAKLYEDEGLTIPLANPLRADSEGRFPRAFAGDGAVGATITD